MQYLQDVQHSHPTWLLVLIDNLALLTWRTSFFAHGDEYPSSLVSGQPTTAPPFASPLSPFCTPQFKLHYLHRGHQQFSVIFVLATNVMSLRVVHLSKRLPNQIRLSFSAPRFRAFARLCYK